MCVTPPLSGNLEDFWNREQVGSSRCSRTYKSHSATSGYSDSRCVLQAIGGEGVSLLVPSLPTKVHDTRLVNCVVGQGRTATGAFSAAGARA